MANLHTNLGFYFIGWEPYETADHLRNGSAAIIDARDRSIETTKLLQQAISYLEGYQLIARKHWLGILTNSQTVRIRSFT